MSPDQHLSPPPVRRAAATSAGAQPRVRLFVPSRAWGGRRRREMLFAAAAIAVLFHVLLTLAILEAPRLWPAPPPKLPPPSSPQDPPTIEMVTDQNKYAGGSKPTPAATPSPPAPPAPPSPPKAQGAPTPSDLPAAPSPSPDTIPPEAPKQDQVQAPTPSPPPQPQSASQPEVDLDPADGLGYGRQDDPHVIPASPDDSHANKMPPYPRAAGRRGEEGSVQMLVSITANGSVTSVEVATSSGYADLDRTAQSAVSHWHFRPAIQNGVGVPTQMMQVFNFKIDR